MGTRCRFATVIQVRIAARDEVLTWISPTRLGRSNQHCDLAERRRYPSSPAVGG